jgi:uncharacterized protein (TIGR03382 family)
LAGLLRPALAHLAGRATAAHGAARSTGDTHLDNGFIGTLALLTFSWVWRRRRLEHRLEHGPVQQSMMKRMRLLALWTVPGSSA